MSKCDYNCGHELHCPFCGHGLTYNHCQDYELGGDEQSVLIDCDNCGKEYLITMHISVDYSATKLHDKCCGNCIYWDNAGMSKYCDNYYNIISKTEMQWFREKQDLGCKNFKRGMK